jgi:hypothetical protein
MQCGSFTREQFKVAWDEWNSKYPDEKIDSNDIVDRMLQDNWMEEI